jgi:hypothetical protein
MHYSLMGKWNCFNRQLFVIDALALTEKAFIDKVLNQDTNFEKDKIYVANKGYL